MNGKKMSPSRAGLSLFHPLTAKWFAEQVGQPTDVQQQAWPKIAAGEHLLITAPTGSGKTFAAFLWALDQLISGKWTTGHTSVLYISPLRALNYDIQRNLLGPLAELRQIFKETGQAFPDIRVLTRSGDTPQVDRRQMLRHPPEILISTPESLNLLLSSLGGRSILTNIAAVILDEIHAVVGTKRGVYLMTAVERLVRLSGEFQRISLSATIRPLQKVAEVLGGYTMTRKSGGLRYTPRPVTIVRSAAQKQYDLAVCFPRHAADPEARGSVWDPLVDELKEIIARNRSTLIFTNSRRLCEMLTLLINQGEEEPVAYAHHGSLSLEIRAEVERKLKAGELRAIVATHSLELGIDIGALDEVVLVQSPFSVSSAVQRVGRAGHRVGQVSRGSLFPTHPKDLLEAAVLAREILSQNIEAFNPVICPLDVLAQEIVSMVGVETWNIDKLFEYLRASYSYRHLSREQFDLVLNMLAGRYASSRVRELKPLISVARLENTAAARRGALQVLYFSGGVIPDRGYFHLRHQETNARIGELDEEFVWEASVGDTFALGTQNWQIQRITHNDVLVLPGNPRGAAAPFWKAEENGRDFHLSERIGQFLEEANARLGDPGFASTLQQVNRLDEAAAGELVDFLKRQKQETGCDLPHRHHLVVELVSCGPGGAPGNQAIIHTMWGGRVNRPLAMALEAAWQARFGQRPEIYVSNDCVVVLLPHEIRGDELLTLVGSTKAEALLRTRLEGSGFFGARFRECASRSLLLPRGRFNERMPLWLSRLRSQKLLEAVLPYEDFPVLLEAWRSCLKDEFDLESLKQLLTELESGFIHWTEVHTSYPSPFGQSDWWRQVNQYMYMHDSPRAEKISRLRGSLLREVVFNPVLRPTVSHQLVERFELKRHRLSPGYSPQTSRELLDWVEERLAIPQDEWFLLLEAMQRDHGLDPEALLNELKDKIILFHPPDAAGPLVASWEMLDRILNTFYGPGEKIHVETLANALFPREKLGLAPREGEMEDWAVLLGEWLQYYGPRPVEFIRRTLGVESERLRWALEDLIDSQKVLQGQLVTEGGPEEVCDSENFEILLRLARAEALPQFEPPSIEWLPLYLAQHQGLVKPPGNIEGLGLRIEQLVCYPAEAGTWESEILPARLQPYDPSWLDTLMQEGELQWVGGEGHRVTFCFKSDMDLLHEDPGHPEGASDTAGRSGSEVSPPGSAPLGNLFPDAAGRYDFSTLLRGSKGGVADLAKRLWDGVWQGQLTNDSFIPLRRAVMNKFKPPERKRSEAEPPRHRMRSARFAGARETCSFAGNWHLLASPELPDDLLETEERKKDRARLLLDRYGILFRELLQRELPPFRWAGVFRSLRIMELSGEVMAGIFFYGIPGPQFISQQAFCNLQHRLPEDPVYWMNATDPASLCGIQLDPIRGSLPARVAGTHLVYRGARVVLISRRNGEELTFNVPPEDPRLPEYMGVLRHLLTRQFQPVKRIAIETINDEKAPQSPYVDALRTSFDVLVDYRNVNLYRKMG
jgi:ATP-dependent Lhr-like helicase